MGRKSYKAFIPTNPPVNFSKPANGHMEWTKPVVVDTTVDVDKAKGRVKKEANANAAATDHFIGVDTTNQTITITLPSTSNVAEGKIFLIKDEGGNAGTNNVTIATTGNVNIDGSSTIVLDSDYAALNIYYNGTEWSVY
tara:strand:+ start:460 stop:876 length:417 start_codon:yes stop_codon:yes gene_type:complete